MTNSNNRLERTEAAIERTQQQIDQKASCAGGRVRRVR